MFASENREATEYAMYGIKQYQDELSFIYKHPFYK